MTPVDIGSRLELMVDDHLLDRLSGSAEFRMHHPVPREIVEGIDAAGGYSFRYMTVFQDDGIYRMYYGIPTLRRAGGRREEKSERICYAESRDGITWTKPSLNLFEHEGSRDNNILWMEDGLQRLGVGGFSPFKDQNPNCPPEHRYKAVAEPGPKGKATLGGNGLLALSSPDGLNWSVMSEGLIVGPRPDELTPGFDSQNLAFWDSVRGEYRIYRRATYGQGPLGVFRDVVTQTSRDFLHWSEPQRLSYPGALPEQLYTNNISPYFRAPHLFVGFPARYVERFWSEAIADLPEVERRKALIRSHGGEPTELEDPTQAGGQRIGTALTDTLLMTSRDGVNFHRQDDAFIRPGLRTRNNWFYPDNYQNWGIVTTASQIEDAPEELSFYVTEGGRREGLSNLCRRYTLRMDGFVSLHASRRGGEASTRLLTFSGKDLVMNFSASAAGSIRVELQDAQGWPLPGFELENCVELLGDDLQRRVRWREGRTLASLAGTPVRVRFQLADADLYAFCFR